MTILQFIAGQFPAQCSQIPLGIRAENDVTQVELDFSAWAEEFGPGVVQLLIRRDGDAAPYPVLLSQSGIVAVWTVSATDLAVRGPLAAEWIYTVGTQVKKSEVLPFYVLRDIGAPGAAPDPYEDWLQQLTELAADAQAASLAIQNMDVEAETLAPGSAATVSKTVDPETGAVTLTFGIPRGQDGGSGPSPYASNPAALGTAAPGVSNDYARGDHVHPKPSAADIGAYALPVGGIPKTDLASSVQASLGKADTALRMSVSGYTKRENGICKMYTNVAQGEDMSLCFIGGIALDGEKIRFTMMFYLAPNVAENITAIELAVLYAKGVQPGTGPQLEYDTATKHVFTFGGRTVVAGRAYYGTLSTDVSAETIKGALERPAIKYTAGGEDHILYGAEWYAAIDTGTGELTSVQRLNESNGVENLATAIYLGTCISQENVMNGAGTQVTFLSALSDSLISAATTDRYATIDETALGSKSLVHVVELDDGSVRYYGCYGAPPTASAVGAVAANQGAGNAGKWLKVDTNGIIVAAELPVYNGGVT